MIVFSFCRVLQLSNWYRCHIPCVTLPCVKVSSLMTLSTNHQLWWWVRKHGVGRKIGGLIKEISWSCVFFFSGLGLICFTAVSITEYFIYLGTVRTEWIYSHKFLRHLQIVIYDLAMKNEKESIVITCIKKNKKIIKKIGI